MLNIVIPMAGRGSRFAEAGYKVPKPFIPIHGVPMIEVVVHNVRPSQPHCFIFPVLKEHLDRFDVHGILERIAPGCTVIPVAQVTEGAACTVLLAQEIIGKNTPLMLANSDQWVDFDINDYLTAMDRQQADSLIMTMLAVHPKWSYVGFDEAGRVNRVVEKQVISNEATVGIYNFRRGRDFVRAAEQMIAKNFRVNNEFYVAPAFNEMIEWDAKIATYRVGSVGQGMWGLGTPEDLEAFIRDPISHRAVALRGNLRKGER